MDDEQSIKITVEAGVPQESYLSPLLFVVYINGTPISPGSQINLFTDDMILYATNKSLKYATRKLQQQVDTVMVGKLEAFAEHY